MILQKWEDFRIYKSVKFSECWYRHLHCERNKQFIDNTQRFIQKIREKAFYKKESQSNVRRLYKSAELIAKYYKNVGILARENQAEEGPGADASLKSAEAHKNGGKRPRNGNFEPRDFAQDAKANLDLLGRASFGEEQTIMFHEKEIQQKLNDIYDHVRNQEEAIVQRTKQKWESDQILPRISEKEIEHTMKIARKGPADPLPLDAQFGKDWDREGTPHTADVDDDEL